MSTLRLGTRGSPLALAQAVLAARALRSIGLTAETVVITTRGDHNTDAALGDLGPGAFASALEEALAEGTIDIAVHSAKDLTGVEDETLPIVGFLERADPRDAWCGAGVSLGDVHAGARVGTSSSRRAALLRRLRPDLDIVPIRGNVQTRLDRRAHDELDAVILAACGLDRLGLSGEIGFRFDPSVLIPESGQGAIALQTRRGELEEIHACVHEETGIAVRAERLVTRALGGGCRVPVAAHAACADGTWTLTGWVGESEGIREARATVSGDDPLGLHDILVEALFEAGAARLLLEVPR